MKLHELYKELESLEGFEEYAKEKGYVKIDEVLKLKEKLSFPKGEKYIKIHHEDWALFWNRVEKLKNDN